MSVLNYVMGYMQSQTALKMWEAHIPSGVEQVPSLHMIYPSWEYLWVPDAKSCSDSHNQVLTTI